MVPRRRTGSCGPSDSGQRVARRILIGCVAAALMVVVLAGYARLGWDRMESECASEASVQAGADGSAVEFSWSWTPPGFTCTWDDVSVTKLWW